jgi:hypothetical protein
MGTHYLTMHFKDVDQDAVMKAVRREAKKRGGGAFVASSIRSWVTVFPSVELLDIEVLESTARDSGAQHGLMLSLYDSDVFCYWYAHNSVIVDYFNSAPDYFGEECDEDMEAVGNPSAFAGLLNVAAQRKLSALIAVRLIDGEPQGGDLPDFEDERHESFAQLLDIPGACGHYDAIAEGEKVEGLGDAKSMQRL